MKRILFVDDEPNVLACLRNLMRRERARWETVYVDGAASALDALAASHFDVVVSDMRMPGMDGIELLERIRERWPTTARVMLSGSASCEEVVRATTAVDVLLLKPCSSVALKTTLERIMERSAA